jgi:DNA-binding NtrC family response regulator
MEKYKIMVIDDEKIVGDMAKLSLEQDGYYVATFLNAKPALERLAEEKFDVVITDLKMKGIDGMEVLRRVKSLYPDVQVIMITAFANLDAAIEALRGEVYDFFPKPVRIKDLKASIARALSKEMPLPKTAWLGLPGRMLSSQYTAPRPGQFGLLPPERQIPEDAVDDHEQARTNQ